MTTTPLSPPLDSIIFLMQFTIISLKSLHYYSHKTWYAIMYNIS